MTHKQIWLDFAGLELLIALLGLAYWLNTGSRAVPGLVVPSRAWISSRPWEYTRANRENIVMIALRPGE